MYIMPRRVKCLATPSLEEEEILLGWREMQRWGILKKNFNKITYKDMVEDASRGDLMDSCYNSVEEEDKGCPSGNAKFWATGRRVASHPCSSS